MQEQQCLSYAKGHETHWIAAIRVYPATPTHQVKVEPLGGDAFKVTSVGARGKESSETLYFHRPLRLKTALKRVLDPKHIQRIDGTSFIKIISVGSSKWFYMSENPVGECSYQ